MRGQLQLSRVAEDYKHYRSVKGLVWWVRGVFGGYPEELDETIISCLQLGCDLLLINTDP